MAVPDLPLASRCQFASTDFAAMHHQLSTVLKPHRLRRLSRVPVSGIICRATLHEISLNLLRIGPSVDVWPGALETFFLVQIPIRGAVQIDMARDRILCTGTTAAVISPGERLHLRWSDDCTQLIVQIPRETIEARLAARLGFRPTQALRFHGAFDLGCPAGRDWRALLDLAARSIDDGGILARGLGAELEGLLLSTLLATQPHNYTDELFAGRRCNAVPYYVLRAEREMHEHLAQPLTVVHLARVAGVSERTLHHGFRRFRATTPMGRLATLRLAAARRRLLVGESGLTVARVAGEVGILQFGRFARAYRNAFGELPSATLRAARRRH